MFYLASASASRKYLLEQIRIPYEAIGHDADESACDWGLPLESLVARIAEHKMAHARLPSGEHAQKIIFVLTADTLTADMYGTIHGKPIDRADGKEKIRLLRAGSRVCTSFCLDMKEWQHNQWITKRRITKTVCAHCVFKVPDEWLDIYLDVTPALQAAGSIALEGYGLQFLETMSGSYSTIIGLPLYELRQALEDIGFFGSV